MVTILWHSHCTCCWERGQLSKYYQFVDSPNQMMWEGLKCLTPSPALPLWHGLQFTNMYEMVVATNWPAGWSTTVAGSSWTSVVTSRLDVSVVTSSARWPLHRDCNHSDSSAWPAASDSLRCLLSFLTSVADCALSNMRTGRFWLGTAVFLRRGLVVAFAAKKERKKCYIQVPIECKLRHLCHTPVDEK